MWITYLPCQRQPNDVQCGDFAIAWAALFAISLQSTPLQLLTKFGKAHFDVGKMRHHLLNCLRRDRFTDFPQNSRTSIQKILNPLKPLVYSITCATGTVTLVDKVGGTN